MTELTPENQPTAPNTKACYRCGTVMPGDTEVCPSCGRDQYRVCYCGENIPVDAPTCPHCGADWSDSRRVRKSRKRRSTRIRPAELLKSGAIGAGIAVGIALAAAILLRHFAIIATAGASLPPDVFQQLALAGQGFGIVVGSWGDWMASHQRTFMLIIGVLAIGAIAGIAAYLTNKGIVMVGTAARRSGHKRSSKRRRSSSQK